MIIIYRLKTESAHLVPLQDEKRKQTTNIRLSLLQLMRCCTFRTIGKWRKRPEVPEDGSNTWLKVLSRAVATFRKEVKSGLLFFGESKMLRTATVFVEASHQETENRERNIDFASSLNTNMSFKIRGNLAAAFIIPTAPGFGFFLFRISVQKKKKTHILSSSWEPINFQSDLYFPFIYEVESNH